MALVRRKAAAIQYRRRVGALGAGALTLLLLAGGIALAGIGGGSKRTVRTAGRLPEMTSTSEEPTTSTEAPTTAAATIVPAPRPTRSTTTTVPRPPRTTTTVWAGKGLTVDVSAIPDYAPTATLVHYVVHVRDDSGTVNDLRFSYGDGTGAVGMGVAIDCAAPDAQHPATPPPPTDRTFEFDHGYRRAGTYVAVAHVGTGGCPWDASEQRDASTTVAATPGPTPSNGPVQPKAFLSQFWPPGGDATVVHVSEWGTDDDGYITRYSVDWGDGSAATVTDYSLSQCHDPGTTWPQTQNGNHADAGHAYSQPGTYTARLTVKSVGCDGKDAQTATADVTLSYPPSPPPTSG